MSNAARAQQEPTMEEILASIRRIISDDTQPADAAAKTKEKPADPAAALPKVAQPAPAAVPAVAEEEGLNQDDIDSVFASMEDAGETSKSDEADDVLELTNDMSDWDEALAEAEATESADVKDDVADEPTASVVEPAAVVFEKVEQPQPPVSAAPAKELPQSTAADVQPQPRPMATQALADALLSPATDAVVSSAFGSLSRTLLNQNPRTVEDLVADMLRPMLKDWLDANLPNLVERMVRAEIERMSRGH